jgi:HlyD family secretion protein
MQATRRLIVRMGILVLAGAGVSSLAQHTGSTTEGPARTTGSPKPGIEKKQGMAVSCQVEKGGRILSLLPDGTVVKKGDLVCELDASDLKDRLTDQTIAMKRTESERKIGQVTHEVALAAVKEYKEGTYLQDKAAIMREIKRAESNLALAADHLDEILKLFQKGTVSKGQKVATELAFQETKFAIEAAQNRLSVLENFTKSNTIKRLISEVEKARSQELAAQDILELEGARAEKTRRQIENCRITAPCDGLVVRRSTPDGASTTLQHRPRAAVSGDPSSWVSDRKEDDAPLPAGQSKKYSPE